MNKEGEDKKINFRKTQIMFNVANHHAHVYYKKRWEPFYSGQVIAYCCSKPGCSQWQAERSKANVIL